MLIIMSVIALIILGAGVAVYRLRTSQLPSLAAPPEDHRLAEQVERLELLEDELQRVKDQADFTESLLTERDSVQSRDALEGNSSD